MDARFAETPASKDQIPAADIAYQATTAGIPHVIRARSGYRASTGPGR